MITSAVLAIVAVCLIGFAVFAAMLTGIHINKKDDSMALYGLVTTSLFFVLGMAAAFCV